MGCEGSDSREWTTSDQSWISWWILRNSQRGCTTRYHGWQQSQGADVYLYKSPVISHQLSIISHQSSVSCLMFRSCKTWASRIKPQTRSSRNTSWTSTHNRYTAHTAHHITLLHTAHYTLHGTYYVMHTLHLAHRELIIAHWTLHNTPSIMSSTTYTLNTTNECWLPSAHCTTNCTIPTSG